MRMAHWQCAAKRARRRTVNVTSQCRSRRRMIVRVGGLGLGLGPGPSGRGLGPSGVSRHGAAAHAVTGTGCHAAGPGSSLRDRDAGAHAARDARPRSDKPSGSLQRRPRIPARRRGAPAARLAILPPRAGARERRTRSRARPPALSTRPGPATRRRSSPPVPAMELQWSSARGRQSRPGASSRPRPGPHRPGSAAMRLGVLDSDRTRSRPAVAARGVHRPAYQPGRAAKRAGRAAARPGPHRPGSAAV